MEIQLAHSGTQLLRDRLAMWLANSSKFDCAVAYATEDGFSFIRKPFNELLLRGGSARVAFDITQAITSPNLIEEIATAPGDARVKLHIAKGSSGILHSKYFYCSDHVIANASVGSHNLTYGGFCINSELSILLSGEAGAEIFSNCRSYFRDFVWSSENTIDPLSQSDFLENYRKIYEKYTARHGTSGQSVLANAEMSELCLSYLEDYKKIESILANSELDYLLGVRCACTKDFDQDSISSGYFKLNFKSNVMNQGNPDQGFICARLESGSLPLGGIRLPQIQTQVDFIQRVALDLNNFLKSDHPDNRVTVENRSGKMTNVDFNIQLSTKSAVLQEIRTVLKQFAIVDHKYIPSVPLRISSGDNSRKLAFLKGYMDFRGRVSISDRVVKSHLRVSAQVSTNALSFGNQLCELMADTVGVLVTVASGENRDRDHILRFQPNESSESLFRMGWQRALVRQFSSFNASAHA